jgi:hypothetical protein
MELYKLGKHVECLEECVSRLLRGCYLNLNQFSRYMYDTCSLAGASPMKREPIRAVRLSIQDCMQRSRLLKQAC